MHSPDRQKPGRKSTVATHPRRLEIEAACAAGISPLRTAVRFGVGRMAIVRHWQGLSTEYRAALTRETVTVEGQRWQEVAAGLAAIGRRHPDAQPDIAALIQRTRHLSTTGGRAHAA